MYLIVLVSVIIKDGKQSYQLRKILTAASVTRQPPSNYCINLRILGDFLLELQTSDCEGPEIQIHLRFLVNEPMALI